MFKNINQKILQYIILASFIVVGLLSVTHRIDNPTTMRLVDCILCVWASVYALHYFENKNTRKGLLMLVILGMVLAGMFV